MAESTDEDVVHLALTDLERARLGAWLEPRGYQLCAADGAEVDGDECGELGPKRSTQGIAALPAKQESTGGVFLESPNRGVVGADPSHQGMLFAGPFLPLAIDYVVDNGLSVDGRAGVLDSRLDPCQRGFCRSASAGHSRRDRDRCRARARQQA